MHPSVPGVLNAAEPQTDRTRPALAAAAMTHRDSMANVNRLSGRLWVCRRLHSSGQAEQEIWSAGTAANSSTERPNGLLLDVLIRGLAVVRFGVPMVLQAGPSNAVASTWPELSAGRPGKANQRPTRWMSRSRAVTPSGSGVAGGLNQP
jgi:hypothetical protein